MVKMKRKQIEKEENIMSRWLIKYLFLGLVLVLILGAGAKPAPAVEKPEDFYKGKMITFMVPFGPGGGYDLWARALAPHIKKHTGATVVVTNMEGAGGLVGGGWLYHTAKPDGLTIAILNTPGMILAEMLDFEGAKYELAKFSWICRVELNPTALLASKASGFKTIEDMQKAVKTIRFTAVDPTTDIAIASAAIIEAFGLKAKIIPGYKGAKERMLAILAGREADIAIVGLGGEYITMVKQGDLTLVAMVVATRHPEFPEKPTLLEMPGLGAEGKKLLELINILFASSRMIAAPPRTPEDRAAFLEKALMASLNEPALIEWAKKGGRDWAPLSAKESKDLITKLLEVVPPAERPKLKDIFIKKYYY
ncbi:MAG: tripartite tricarboxylate transporter substrate-binding protein [Thermodesulfobacteriota bacterium]|nr:tripartite tricarboxylate transporter substrate-binding protein [Thermodesulfobacteriota bacterium]